MQIGLNDILNLPNQMSFNDLQKKFVQTLISQARCEDMKNIPIEELNVDDILSLLEAREIYSSMFGFQFVEEKTLLPELITIFNLKKKSV